MTKFRDQIIIIFCILFRIPLSNRLQKHILKTAILHIHNFYGMCDAICFSFLHLYNIEISPYILHKLIPVFNCDNFYKITNSVNTINESVYWTNIYDKSSRVKFLNWCIKQL